jgi:hypothetical protein
MKQLLFILLILLSGTSLFAGNPFAPAKPDSATSLSEVKENYKLSGITWLLWLKRFCIRRHLRKICTCIFYVLRQNQEKPYQPLYE